jgi:hypothetical protein
MQVSARAEVVLSSGVETNGRRDVDSTQKTALYREVNATTEAMLKQFQADHAGSFLCECPDVGCDRRLALTHQEYERVRRSGAYLVSLDCVCDADVLERTDRYAAIEFRRTLTGGSSTESSRSGSSRLGSSQRASSLPAPSRTERSATARSAPAPSTAARQVVVTLGRGSQSARVLAGRNWQAEAYAFQPSSPTPLPPAC